MNFYYQATNENSNLDETLCRGDEHGKNRWLEISLNSKSKIVSDANKRTTHEYITSISLKSSP